MLTATEGASLFFGYCDLHRCFSRSYQEAGGNLRDDFLLMGRSLGVFRGFAQYGGLLDLGTGSVHLLA